MTFYKEKEQLYLETDMLGVGLQVSLSQERDQMQFPKEQAPDNMALQPIAFICKSLISVGTWYNNIKSEFLGLIGGLERSITAASPM